MVLNQFVNTHLIGSLVSFFVKVDAFKDVKIKTLSVFLRRIKNQKALFDKALELIAIFLCIVNNKLKKNAIH